MAGLARVAGVLPEDRPGAQPQDPPALPPAPPPPPKYARSALDGETLGTLHARLGALAARGLARDSNLSLSRLARAVGAAPNAVSQTLNQREGGFHPWLARVRIADAKALLLADPGLSLMEAAFAAGFNTKSTFYGAFRCETGQTPAAWRARQAAEVKTGLRPDGTGQSTEEDSTKLLPSGSRKVA